MQRRNCANDGGVDRYGAERMRLRRRATTPKDIQILERRQILHIALHPQALRTSPRTGAPNHGLTGIVEWLRGAATAVARAEPGHIIRLLLHTRERHTTRAVHTRSRRTSEQAHEMNYGGRG
jgi:hypothetical protein